MLFTPRLGLAWSCGGKIEIVAQGTEQGGGGLGPRGVGCRHNKSATVLDFAQWALYYIPM